MSFSAGILVLSLVTSLLDLGVSSCDKNCADKPVFSPSHLIVKYGDPASATCSVCQQDCLGNSFNIEHAVGDVEQNETKLHWKVDSLTEWDLNLTCFYNTAPDHRCCTPLPVTVYKPPDKVTFSFGDHTGPLLIDNLYHLRCTLENVAPFEKFEAVFYKNNRAFGQVYSYLFKDKTPLTKYLELDFVPQEYNHGEEYWCEAEFRLDSEGQQPPPVVRSQRVTAIVHYKPKFEADYDSRWITLTEGYKLQLNCTSSGNPSPSYNWTLPSGSVSSTTSSVFTIESIATKHQGTYTCIVSNGYGTLTEEFRVDVIRNYVGYLIAGVLALVVLLVLVGVFIYYRC
ncbi:vascular cell adhesion protein 1-like [Halichoeres trimaculatus]|uniref:vascular cell adhesion protein 1-like n=1 Tax=Halichoeres trimaculatus TaxID=147232 RepID=UPI003D9E614C